jgi:4a-hydroxytetrahydrobiopterin dehydratase
MGYPQGCVPEQHDGHSAMDLLTPAQITGALEERPLWKQAGDTIQRTYAFVDFVTGIEFVRAVAAIAEEVQHHPDIDIRWNQVTLTLSTHDSGGLTALDFEVAGRCDVQAAGRVRVGTD